jgi:hypothetical protein
MISDVKDKADRSQTSDKSEEKSVGMVMNDPFQTGIKHEDNSQQREAEHQVIFHVMEGTRF